MSRPLRIEYSGAYYHVMNRGRGRQRIYRGQADYRRLAQKDADFRRRVEGIEKKLLKHQT